MKRTFLPVGLVRRVIDDVHKTLFMADRYLSAKVRIETPADPTVDKNNTVASYCL